MVQNNLHSLEIFRKNLSSCHANIENNPALIQLTSPGVSLEYYTCYLKKMYGYTSSFEDRFNNRLSRLLPDADKRKKAGILASDISFLDPGWKKENTELFPFEMTAVSDISLFARAYVLEGSVLGGRYISENLKKTGLFENNRGISFLQVYGNETGTMWKSFLERFASAVEEKQAWEEAEKAARDTFTQMDNWFSK